jgi:GH15 family glucan-1,4-alpha-glucosidase
MSLRIEDYALIGDCQTAALVSRDGSIDWLCFPRFDSGACFAALLGTKENGRWLLAPQGEVSSSRRRYRDDSLILETDYVTAAGEVTVIDFMPVRGTQPDLIRQVVGRRGEVPMSTELIIRFDYGSLVPWVQKKEDGITAIAGPDMLRVRTDVPLKGKDLTTVGEFMIHAGETRNFVLTWHPSYEPLKPLDDPFDSLESTEKFWKEWSSHCTYQGEWRQAVMRSLITLKALTYLPTGGIVAAATTSLPEWIGGIRNWDYRYCWLRDATFTLYALLLSGYHEEAKSWREWLIRAVAGNASQLNIMYGVAGERRLPEISLDWLPGYDNSTPVRIGNAAHEQFQLDVFGEVLDTLHLARRSGLQSSEDGWRVERELLKYLESHWAKKDEGIWETRGPRQHFTHSKVMAWVAFDRAVKNCSRDAIDGDHHRWCKLRKQIHAEICQSAFNTKLGAFAQSYGSSELDASLLMMPLVGFLPATDSRIQGTVKAIEQKLLHGGFVRRYSPSNQSDGLPSGEGVFLPCTFWLADNYALLGRHDDARRVMENLLAIRNDVGLLSEEYDPVERRLLGNFPQAFSHIGLVNTARNLSRHGGPAEHRQDSAGENEPPLGDGDRKPNTA